MARDRPPAEARGGPHREQERAVAEREMATLALSETMGASGVAVVRALAWQRIVARLGVSVPLVVVHDVGAVLVGLARPSPRTRGRASAEIAEGWRRLLQDLETTSLARTHGAWKHRDAMVGVVLARILGGVFPQLPEPLRAIRPRIGTLDLHAVGRIDVADAFARRDTSHAQVWLDALARNRLLLVLEVEQIDIDALRLIGLFGGAEQAVLGGFALSDLYQTIRDPSLADVVDFSLELLPSLLEVQRRTGQQTFGLDGYAAIERRGKLDDMVLSQLAYDDEVFEQKLVDRELFFYTHEKQLENEERLHLVLVDGSASMRGVREVFARGLALALGKRLALLGDAVELRFFDARIYEGVAVTGSGIAEVPYVLRFRAEHGRNYARVAEQLQRELASGRYAHRSVVVYFLSHGSCRFPPETVFAMAGRVHLHGVFILPEAPLDLPYLDALTRVHVLDEQAVSTGQRSVHARRIIAAAEQGVGAGGGRR
ncbi:MAG: hypothetical protein D6705_13440 [Deltaproteobacteria bacterium]|nr:MAG: hypothetical protein D6705_13440 [Deltaproteobacteria bacterium]